MPAYEFGTQIIADFATANRYTDSRRFYLEIIQQKGKELTAQNKRKGILLIYFR
jgi:hypothetical protein